jgi:hypothetical protein
MRLKKIVTESNLQKQETKNKNYVHLSIFFANTMLNINLSLTAEF